MDVEALLICQLCQMEFHTEEDLSLHSCIDIEIKQEKRDSKTQDPLEFSESSDLDVSEEFFDTILKQVDVLCYIINNGDSNLNRTIKVNHILSTALSCYKIHAENQIDDDLDRKKYLDQHVDDMAVSENDERETESERDLSRNDIKNIDVISKEIKENKHKSRDITTTDTTNFFPDWKKQIEDNLNDELETESESDISRNDYKHIPTFFSKDTNKRKHKSKEFVETDSESDLSRTDYKKMPTVISKETKENKNNSKDLTTKTANFYFAILNDDEMSENDEVETESESDLSRNTADVISKEEINENKTEAKRSKYGCNMCDKTFTLKSSLKTHVQNLHKAKDLTETTNFHPPILNQNDKEMHRDSTKDSIDTEKEKAHRSGNPKGSSYITKRHLLPYVIHNSENEFNCSICSKSYSQKLNLFEHLKLKHKREIEQERSANLIHQIPKTKQKRFRRTDELIDRMFEFVKSQCGKHKNREMARMLGLPKTTMIQRIEKAQKEGFVFYKHEGKCHFCDLKKDMPKGNTTKKDLLPYSKYYRVTQKCGKEEKVQCLLCNESYWLKCDLLQHFKYVHRRELIDKSKSDSLKSEKEEVVYNDEPLEDCNSIDEMKQDLLKDLINCSKTRTDPFLQNAPRRNKDYLTQKYLLPYISCNSNEDEFHCLICSKTYDRRFKVLGHLRAMHRSQIVEEQKPIAEKPIAETSYKYDSNIRKEHMLPYMIYINEDEFQCSICNEYYQKRAKLFDHFRFVHKSQIVKEQKTISETSQNDSRIKK